MRDQILAYAMRYHGEWAKIAKAIGNQEPWDKITSDESFTTIGDDDYPSKLRMLEYPPWIIFYRGDLSLCEKPAISIVGSRNMSVDDEQHCKHIAHLLKLRNVLVSGLAMGIDGCVHREALSNQTIGIIGCGLNVYYPQCNIILQQTLEKNHLVISEYPNGVKPLAYHFPWRNRLIAALGNALVVIAATPRSGTMLTVNEAIALNRAIYCVPHAFGDASGLGCNQLISQGANILCDDVDIANIETCI